MDSAERRFILLIGRFYAVNGVESHYGVLSTVADVSSGLVVGTFVNRLGVKPRGTRLAFSVESDKMFDN